HPDSQPRRASDDDPRRRSEVLDDLRADATPWRSDVMIEAMAGALRRYEAIVSRGGWPTGAGTRTVPPGDGDEGGPGARQRLMISGELRRSSGGFSYGEDWEAAVRRYQYNNGLRVTGRVDKPTLLALNVPAQARLAQLRLNLHRLQELTAQRVEDRYVLVN